MGNTAQPSARVIKRYSNRKLYDTKASTYVTLLNISDMVRSGEQVQVIDNSTKEDKTDVTLALIISEELKANPREIPVAALKALIRSRGERLMHQLKEGPLAKLFGGDEFSAEPSGVGGCDTWGRRTESPGAEGAEGSAAEGWGESAAELEKSEGARREGGELGQSEDKADRGIRATLEQWQHLLDERIRAVLPDWAGFREYERRLDDLNRRVAELERRMDAQDGGMSPQIDEPKRE